MGGKRQTRRFCSLVPRWYADLRPLVTFVHLVQVVLWVTVIDGEIAIADA